MRLNLEDYAAEAGRRLPRFVADLIDGGAGDERTLARNRRAFGQVALRPRVLQEASRRQLSTTVLGTPISLPVLLGPTANVDLIQPQGELAAARAAARADTIYALSTHSAPLLEAVAAQTAAAKWFQLYAPADRDELTALLGRAARAGYTALCLTVDVPVGGLRERARRSGVTYPLALDWRLALQSLSRPRWALAQLRGRPELLSDSPAHLRAIASSLGAAATSARSGPSVAGLSRFITPADVEFIRERWSGPLLIKGIHTAEDACLARELGADALVVSNHGGRQMDGTLASLEILVEVIDAVGDGLEVLLDSGVRRGADVIKALALGARAVLIGRPYLHGLTVAGESGVLAILDILRAEIDTTLALLGVGDVADLGREHVQLLEGFAAPRREALAR